MDDLKRYIRSFGILGLIRFGMYPLTHLILNPFILLISIFRSLFAFITTKKLSHLKHFHLAPTLTYFFYASRAWNLKKFGRTGFSKFLGLGNYSLARCFNYSLVSLFTYWKFPALTVFLGMFLWLFSFIFFPDKGLFFYCSLGLVSISSLFFTNTFRAQNYNVIGWMFLPIALIGIYESNVVLIIISLTLSSFGSFTVVVLGNILCVAWGLFYQEWQILFCGIPAAIKLAFHFYPFLKLKSEDSKKILFKVIKAIGATDKVRYQRVKAKSLDLIKIYLILLDIQFLIGIYLVTGKIDILYSSVLVIYIINSVKVRFADDQSMHMLKLSVSAVTVLYISNFFILPFFWILISPLPLLIGYFQMKVLDILPISEPINTHDLEDSIDVFIDKIKPGSKVLLAFEDPGNVYEKVFNGFRNHIEAPIYRAMLKNVHFFPDWWAVFELNYEGATEIWGTETLQIVQNMKKWDCDYVISYSTDDKASDPIINDPDFQLIDTLNWDKFDHIFEDYPKLQKPGLAWHLMQKVN